MTKLGEQIKRAVEINNIILENKEALKELDEEKKSRFFDLDTFLKEHYRIMDLISKGEEALRNLYKEI